MEAHPNPRDPLALNHKLNRVAGRRSLVTKSRPRDAKQMPEKSNQLSPDPSEIWSSSPMTSRLLRTVVSSTRHPDAQTPALDPSSTSKTSQTGSMPSLQSRAFPCMGFKVRRVLQWLRTPAGWNLGMTFFSAVFAISFGVFTILAWVVAVKANQKADLAILIAKYQYKLDEYNTNLTIFATKLAMQSRDDGRLSNRLQYYALCMSNSTLFPGLCERLMPGSNESMESFATDFNNTFPLGTGDSPDPTPPSDDPLSKPPELWDGALSSRLFDGLGDDERRRLPTANRIKDVVPAIVTIPAIFMLAGLLTLAVH